MPFIPHTPEELSTMLATIGVDSIEQLFAEIPQDLRCGPLSAIPEGLTEMELSRLLQERAEQDKRRLCFIGAGAYEHHIPAAVWEIASRGEFMTAYTPYQAEASQGTLQLLYEYQTMMAGLTGMDVSNASLYDGASALAEAILMAVRTNKKSKARRVLVAGTLHPHYWQTIKTIIAPQAIELLRLPMTEGITPLSSLTPYQQADIAALVIPQPNFFGCLEDIDSLTDWAHEAGALSIAVVNPVSLAVLKEPGQWGTQGVDIVCGEGQPLGVPLASGGPYFGFLCCKQAYVRQMPGRIIGRTVDKEGKPGFTLTLQAREQHIRRSKATSNICTNQGLLVTAATIYMSLLGPEGLERVARLCHANTRLLIDQLTGIPGVERVFNQPFFHEAAIRVPIAAEEVIKQLLAADIQGGLVLEHYYPELKNCILVCATETKTVADIEYYREQLSNILSAPRHPQPAETMLTPAATL